MMEKRRKTRGRRRPRASTQDVVGTNSRDTEVPRKWRNHYNRLINLREHMLRRQANLERDALQELPKFSMHMADAGTDSYDRDFALGMLSSEQDAVYQIEQALDRIRNGTYGRCELTGKPIEEDRLAAVPWTRFSATAERQLERQGIDIRSRLGPRETVAKSSEPNHDREAA